MGCVKIFKKVVSQCGGSKTYNRVFDRFFEGNFSSAQVGKLGSGNETVVDKTHAGSLKRRFYRYGSHNNGHVNLAFPKIGDSLGGGVSGDTHTYVRMLAVEKAELFQKKTAQSSLCGTYVDGTAVQADRVV